MVTKIVRRNSNKKDDKDPTETITPDEFVGTKSKSSLQQQAKKSDHVRAMIEQKTKTAKSKLSAITGEGMIHVLLFSFT